jgi:hypothetical protein
MNARKLAMRDPAVAALIGLMPASFGHEGARARSGSSPRFGYDPLMAEFGLDDNLADAAASEALMNQDISHGALQNASELAIDRRRLLSDNSIIGRQQSELASWVRQRDLSRAYHREHLIDPNAGLAVKVGTYSFPINQTLVLGSGEGISMTLQPAVKIRPERVVSNAPCVGFAFISGFSVANVNANIGGSDDAFTFSPLAQGVKLGFPPLDPANRLTVTGTYSGIVPSPFSTGTDYDFTMSFQGPAHLTPQG